MKNDVLMQKMVDGIYNVYSKLSVFLTWVFLYLPVSVVLIYGFNRGPSLLVWEGFGLNWHEKLLNNPELKSVIWNTLLVSGGSTLLSTVLGTGLGVALERFPSRRADGPLNALVIVPILIPEIVMAIGLLFFFSKFLKPFLGWAGFELRSAPAVIAGHVALTMSYVTVLVRTRLKGFDKSLEEAAMDLGASTKDFFLRILLPHLMPALVSGALLSFALSLDDFYISYFATVGGSGFKTLPLFLYTMQGKGSLSPELNALASLMLILSMALVIVVGIFQGSSGELLSRKDKK